MGSSPTRVYKKKPCSFASNTLFLCIYFIYSVGITVLVFFFFLNLLSVMEGKVERASSEKRWTFKRICVFCGSKPGSKSIFSDATVALGKQLVINHHPKKKNPHMYQRNSSFCYLLLVLYIPCDFIRLKGTLIWFMVEEVKA